MSEQNGENNEKESAETSDTPFLDSLKFFTDSNGSQVVKGGFVITVTKTEIEQLKDEKEVRRLILTRVGIALLAAALEVDHAITKLQPIVIRPGDFAGFNGKLV